MSTRSSRSATCLAGLGTLFLYAPPVSAVTLSVRAVKVNETRVPNTNHVSVQPGDRVVAEFYLRGWNENWPASRLKTFQHTLDRLGYSSGARGLVLPRGWDSLVELTPCDTDVDCPGNQRTCDLSGFCAHFCGGDTDCPPDYPVCDYLRGLSCIGPLHAPELYAFIDETRTDWVHRGFVPIFAVRTVHLDYAYGSTTLVGNGPQDAGLAKYAGTLELSASDDACGTFTIGAVSDWNITFVELSSAATDRAFLPSIEPLSIHVACQTSACCAFRSPCENTSRTECAARGGVWQEGQFCGADGQSCPKLPTTRDPTGVR